MTRINKRTTKSHLYEPEARLAGGFGTRAAKQDAEALLRRSVMACLLWEDIAYEDGQTVAQRIGSLVPLVDPQIVREIAVEARFQQKLRHVPLLIAREMARHDSHKQHVQSVLREIIHRPDELAEFLAIYWGNGDRQKVEQHERPLANSVKRGLADAFTKFDEYQLAKWNRQNAIKLRDVLFMVHAKPKDKDQADLWKRLVDDKLTTPDTWEVGLSAAKNETDKRRVWESLIERNKLGALAVLKNLRNMQQACVPRHMISMAIEQANPSMLLPINFLAARNAASDFTRQIESLMFKCAAQWPKLPGWTVFVVDVSGSMGAKLSDRSDFHRTDAAAAMAVLAAEVCENIVVYATAGSDGRRIHATAKVKPHRGFALADEIKEQMQILGGGGIFTRQCLEYIREHEKEAPDRIIIFSDSQDCDLPTQRTPKPFGKYNYIVDVSCHKHGVAYDGIWDAEIAGWSEHFLRFISAYEMQGSLQAVN